MNKYEYRDYDFNLDYYDSILSEEECNKWAKYLEYYLLNINPKIITGNRRIGTIFGTGETYAVKYFGKVSHRKVWPWETIPSLLELKTYVESICEEKFTICLVQYYKNGSIFITPHRDNVLLKNVKISGLSFGPNLIK